MKQNTHFVKPFFVGLASSVAATIFIYFTLAANAEFVAWLNRWQTLIGAFVALSGAALTVRALEKQIRQDRQARDAEEMRFISQAEAKAARALSYFIRYMESILGSEVRFSYGEDGREPNTPSLRYLRNWSNAHQNKFVGLPCPDEFFYEHTNDALACPDVRLSVETGRLIKSVEVFIARSNGGHVGNFDMYIDAVKLLKQAEHILQYIYERYWQNDGSRMVKMLEETIKVRFELSLEGIDEIQKRKIEQIKSKAHFGLLD